MWSSRGYNDNLLVQYFIVLFFKMGQPRPLFHLFSVLSYKQINVKNVQISNQYMVPGFELTTFRTWIVTHNH